MADKRFLADVVRSTMKTVDVKLGSRSYQVQISSGLLDQLGARARTAVGENARQAIVVSNATVSSLYLDRAINSLERSKFTADAKKIQALVARFGIGAIVFGLPLNMDGSEGPRAQATRAFARNLAAHIGLPTLFWDERLSTAAVNRMLINFDTTRRRRAALVDKMAAAYILQGFLEALGASRHSQTHS